MMNAHEQPDRYADRRSSAFLDRYSSPVSEMVTRYVLPQENGHHTDTRWLALIQKSSRRKTKLFSSYLNITRCIDSIKF